MTAVTRRTAIAHSYLSLLDERRSNDAAQRAADLAHWASVIAEALGWDGNSAHRLGDAAMLDEISVALLGPRDYRPHVSAAQLGNAIDHEQREWIARQDERWDEKGELTPAGSRILHLARTWIDLRTNHNTISAITACWADAGRSLWPEAVQALTRALKA